ncbi:hypothetical protein Lalb_Chr04g0262161 [Lupinus albus]|uniref:Uncharacterized protein n=1 Tax=Lupinus albus TaxID=3870 RepID=A0A6A4QNX1_LUPAL|nr:hypothetical protein Lalb_Chr04g0262161 [Lupinus albus]
MASFPHIANQCTTPPTTIPVVLGHNAKGVEHFKVVCFHCPLSAA